MWITQVELHNIKSYGKRTTIDLVQGVNAICGKNGAGKSTILEAIGLALFGKSAYKNQEQFVHEKAKRGEITITLLDNRDERLYQVVRPIRGGPPYVYDPETKRQLATGVDDVQSWLRDCIQVEPTTDLKALFENAIGVAQGLLTVSFLETDTNRRKVFDPLLNVEDYKQAYDKLRAVNTQVKDWQSENTARQARLEGQLEGLPSHQAEVQDLIQKIQAAETQLDELTVKLDALAGLLASLEKQREQVNQLTRQVEKLADGVDSGQTQLRTAEIELEQARQAKVTMEQCEADYQAYEQAQKDRDKLEGERKIWDEIQKRLVTTERQAATLEQNVNNVQKQLQDVANAEARLIELRPQVEKQQSLEQDLQQAQKAVETLRAAKQRLTEEKQRQQSLEQELIEVRTQLQQRQVLTQEIEQLEHQRHQQLEELTRLGDQVVSLEQQLGELHQAMQEAQGRLNDYKNLQARIQEADEMLPQRQAKLHQLQAEVVQRQDLEIQQEALARRRQQWQAQLMSLELQLNDQEARERQAQQALNDRQNEVQRLKNYQANLTAVEDKLVKGQSELTEFETGVARRQQLLAEITALETEGVEVGQQRESIKDSASRYQTQIAEINKAMMALEVEADTPCPVCRKPLSEHDIGSLKGHYQTETTQLTAQLAEVETSLQELDHRFKWLHRQPKKLRAELETLPNQTQLERQKEMVAGYQAEATELQTKITPLAGAPTQVDQLQGEVKRIQETLSRLKQAQAELREADQADERKQQQCQAQIGQLARPTDVEQLETELKELQANLERWRAEAEPLAEAPQRLADLQAQDQALSEQKAKRQKQSQAIGREREQLAHQIQQRQTRINELAAPGRVDELQIEIEDQMGVVAEWQDKVDELTSAPEQLGAVEAELNGLGNPRHAYQVAEAEAAKRPNLEAELAQFQARLQEAYQVKTAIEQELSPFAHLDAEFEQVNTILNQTQRAYQTYLEQRAIAELLPQREAKVAEIRQSVADLEQQKESVAQKLAEAQIGYDPVDHQAKEKEQEETNTKRTRLETQLTGYRELLLQLQAKVAALEVIVANLAELKQEDERLVRLQEVVDFIRRTIRDAGPEITRRLVRAVSLRADQIFADIMNDYQQELIWDENYGISIRRDSYTRDFQQLSGGEAMAAALAVRLALLQSMSAIDVAFFDEPTANLDPERRANLAEQIARIKGFSQLVVISHDDTFEQDTGHVIHIAKNEQGYSQVV